MPMGGPDSSDAGKMPALRAAQASFEAGKMPALRAAPDSFEAGKMPALRAGGVADPDLRLLSPAGKPAAIWGVWAIQLPWPWWTRPRANITAHHAAGTTVRPAKQSPGWGLAGRGAGLCAMDGGRQDACVTGWWGLRRGRSVVNSW